MRRLVAGIDLEKVSFVAANCKSLSTRRCQVTISTSLPVQPHQSSPNVWDSIWAVVQDRGLQVGDQLPSIRELADRLEVKQTSVRDALLKAESQGLIKILPRAGAFLRAITPAAKTQPGTPAETPLPDAFYASLVQEDHNLFHLLDARRLVEIELAGRSAERRRLEDLLPVRRSLEAMLKIPETAARSDYVDLDIRFHIEIARLSGNFVLFAVQKTLMELLRRHLNEVPRDLERRTVTDRSHIAIYEALVSGNAEKARNEMREHLSLAYDSMLQDLQAAPVTQRS
jgi:DNA-binding FadR family transcriptional regulator